MRVLILTRYTVSCAETQNLYSFIKECYLFYIDYAKGNSRSHGMIVSFSTVYLQLYTKNINY